MEKSLFAQACPQNHGFVTARIGMAFDEHLKDTDCFVIRNFIGLHLSEKDCYGPDVMVICDKKKVKESGGYGAPDLEINFADIFNKLL